MDLGADSEEYDVKAKWVRVIRRNNMVVAVYYLVDAPKYLEGPNCGS